MKPSTHPADRMRMHRALSVSALTASATATSTSAQSGGPTGWQFEQWPNGASVAVTRSTSTDATTTIANGATVMLAPASTVTLDVDTITVIAPSGFGTLTHKLTPYTYTKNGQAYLAYGPDNYVLEGALPSDLALVAGLRLEHDTLVTTAPLSVATALATHTVRAYGPRATLAMGADPRDLSLTPANTSAVMLISRAALPLVPTPTCPSRTPSSFTYTTWTTVGVPLLSVGVFAALVGSVALYVWLTRRRQLSHRADDLVSFEQSHRMRPLQLVKRVPQKPRPVIE